MQLTIKTKLNSEKRVFRFLFRNRNRRIADGSYRRLMSKLCKLHQVHDLCIWYVSREGEVHRITSDKDLSSAVQHVKMHMADDTLYLNLAEESPTSKPDEKRSGMSGKHMEAVPETLAGQKDISMNQGGTSVKLSKSKKKVFDGEGDQREKRRISTKGHGSAERQEARRETQKKYASGSDNARSSQQKEVVTQKQ